MNEAVKKDLPENWAQGQIKDIVTIRNGCAFKSKDFNDEGGAPVIRQTNLSSRIVNFNKPKYLPIEFLDEFKSYQIHKGDVLIGLSGSIGNLSRYLLDEPALQNQRTGLLVEHAPGSIKYVEYYLQLIKEQLLDAAKGVAVQNISSKTIENWNIPIAPPEQQKRIAAKIEELFTHIDAGIASLQAAKKLLKQYRQSVLKAAVTGELTKDWREQNNLSKESWKYSTIGEVANVETGKTPKRSSEEFWEKGTIPWLTSSATSKEFTDHADQFVTQTAVDGGLKLFEPGTLLLAMYGEGKTRGQVTEITFQATCNQACAAITVDEDKVIRAFTRIRLYENYEQIRKAASGGNQPNLNLSKVRDISLPLPSLEEQGEIVARVGQKFIFIERLEIDLETQLLKAGKNKQSILASAFSGSFK